ncbi:hypothetical protein [Streptomyces sp. NPDC055287]
MSAPERDPQAPVRPVRTERPAERAMKAVLLVAAVVGTLVLSYVAIFVGLFAVAG